MRFIAATTVDLRLAIQERRFREDLFDRLMSCPSRCPAPGAAGGHRAAARQFLPRDAGQFGRLVTVISPRAFEPLQRYSWPGNVRELENRVERSVALASESVLQLDNIPLDLTLAPVGSTPDDVLSLRARLEFVHQLFRGAATEHPGTTRWWPSCSASTGTLS